MNFRDNDAAHSGHRAAGGRATTWPVTVGPRRARRGPLTPDSDSDLDALRPVTVVKTEPIHWHRDEIELKRLPPGRPGPGAVPR